MKKILTWLFVFGVIVFLKDLTPVETGMGRLHMDWLLGVSFVAQPTHLEFYDGQRPNPYCIPYENILIWWEGEDIKVLKSGKEPQIK